MKSFFNKVHDERKRFIKENGDKSFAVREGKKCVLISAPHGVSQVRLGRPKFSEIGSLATALYVAEKTDSFLIAKTKNEFDDANFDEKCEYKDECYKLIRSHGIKYVIDFHGLSHKRGIDVNFGTHIGRNVEVNKRLFEDLKSKFEKEFIVTIDQPFMGEARTIAGSCKNKFPDLWTLQVEIDCAITNKKEYEKKYFKLVEMLIEFINQISL